MAITNAQIAQKILDMVDARIQFDLEHHEWLTGVVGGGDFSDGKYLLTNPITLVSRYTTSPAQLEDDVNGLVNSASTFKTDAETAAANAGISETNAAASAASALSEKGLAETAKVNAENAQSAAENAAVTAIAQAGAALTSANNAATSAANALTSETNAATSETNAGISETNALAHELKGQDWATEAEDVQVEVGLYSAFHWAAKAAASAASFVEVNDLTAAVTWANVPNANITQGSVTQHQAALTITESQISDLTHITNYLTNDASDTMSSSGSTVLTIEGTGAGYTNGALRLRSLQADNARGGGIYSYSDNNDVEWYFGRPYSSNDEFHIVRATGNLGPSATVADDAHVNSSLMLRLDNAGNLYPQGSVDVSSGRVIAGLVEDVGLGGVSGSIIIGGDGTAAHIAIDNNEIMAKTNATTAGTLNLQVNGGTVACGGAVNATQFNEGGSALSSLYLGISAKAADSSLLNGVAESTAATANTIVKRQGSGYINAVYFNSSQGAENTAASHYIYQNGSDGYYRKKTLANARTEIVTAAAVNAVATEASTVSTAVKRDASGDIKCRLLRSEYDSTNSSINYIMTQIDTVSNNYVRPSTPAQFRASVNAGYLGDQPYTVSTADPSGGGDGDFWFKREA